ncbi:MAG: hypothetical protein EBT06_13555 [Gammaproteobacteria bacterium]|nr:hypothetical protein [Gammaproteobacteria bacterium]NBT45906.1 hypothetical protein [Gammaproteobacteria bacterium]NBY21725.1 hypothetical protein [Gammaproteobacteria bacterium]NDG87444.1 hypothetical protein [Gammaproteobacteria bacterium]
MKHHPSLAYLTAMSPVEAENLLVAIEALREIIWDLHGDSIADMEGEPPFADTHTEDPDFLKKRI